MPTGQRVYASRALSCEMVVRLDLIRSSLHECSQSVKKAYGCLDGT